MPEEIPNEERETAGQRGTDSRQAFRNYVLLQIPGVVLVALGLVVLHYLEWLTLPIAVSILFAWIAKDAVMYRFIGSSYGPGPPHGTDALVGQEGIVDCALSPQGSIRLGAELWTARVEGGADSQSPGTRVRVTRVEGFVIVVVPATSCAGD